MEAVADIVRALDRYGVRYTLSSESCTQALAQARRQAVPVAQQDADDLAASFDLVLGNVINVVEYYPAFPSFAYVRGSADICTHQENTLGFDLSESTMVDFDAEQEVKVAVGLQVTYRIQ